MVVVRIRICDAAEDFRLPVLIAIVRVRDRIAGAAGIIAGLAGELIAVVETERGYRTVGIGSASAPEVSGIFDSLRRCTRTGCRTAACRRSSWS